MRAEGKTSRRGVDCAAGVQMEGGFLDGGEVPGPARRRRALGDCVTPPAFGTGVGARQLGEGEGLPHALAELFGDDLDLWQQTLALGRVPQRLLEASVALLPFL